MASNDLLTTNVTLPIVSGGTLAAAGTWSVPILRMPGTSHGGGITIVRADLTANVAIGAGSAPSWQLVTQTSANAAIATVASNGSAALTAGTAAAGTISTAYVPGTVGFLAVKYGHAIFGAATPVYLVASLQYYVGRGSA